MLTFTDSYNIAHKAVLVTCEIFLEEMWLWQLFCDNHSHCNSSEIFH